MFISTLSKAGVNPTVNFLFCEYDGDLFFRAIHAGVCGVPSYQVNGGAVIWGQDRLNIVADLLCGWRDPVQHSTSKL